MHIPDNFLSAPVWASLDAVAFPALALVSRKAQSATSVDRLPFLGVMGAFVFAAQMINFPVGIGTSGHLVGGTLLACLVGPWAAALVVTSILVIQALVFQDGGVLALGANIFNMALFGVLAGYIPIWLSHRRQDRTLGRFPIFLGGFASVLTSGGLALSELALSRIHISATLVTASLGVFSINALMEGAITVSVVHAIERLRPGSVLARVQPTVSPGSRPVLLSVLSVTLLLTCVGILIASTHPDGLQRLGAVLGMSSQSSAWPNSPLHDYQIRGLGAGWLSRSLAGLTGVALIYSVCTLGSVWIHRLRRPSSV